MTTRALVAIGIGQCVNWGVLYYAFAILVVPLQRDLGVATWVVTGAFSLALMASAVAAPSVGRWCDRGKGPLLMQGAGFAAPALLIAWVLTSSVVSLYAIWAGLGLCMAALLYEPAFMIVGRSYRDPSERLRALALITIFGGLASTVFLPATTSLVVMGGWRVAVLCLAAVLMGSTLFTRSAAFSDISELPAPPNGTKRHHTLDPLASSRSAFVAIASVFTLGTFASGAFAANLIPALGERGIPSTTAALVGGAMGVMQLPGRALLLHGRLAASPWLLLAIGLLLHAAGFSIIVLTGSTPAIVMGALVFATGAGLMTIVRPYLIQTVFSIERAGDLNGRVARQQQLARAAGPVVVALLASRFGYASVFGALAVSFALAGLAVPATLGGTTTESAKESI